MTARTPEGIGPDPQRWTTSAPAPLSAGLHPTEEIPHVIKIDRFIRNSRTAGRHVNPPLAVIAAWPTSAQVVAPGVNLERLALPPAQTRHRPGLLGRSPAGACSTFSLAILPPC